MNEIAAVLAEKCVRSACSAERVGAVTPVKRIVISVAGDAIGPRRTEHGVDVIRDVIASRIATTLRAEREIHRHRRRRSLIRHRVVSTTTGIAIRSQTTHEEVIKPVTSEAVVEAGTDENLDIRAEHISLRVTAGIRIRDDVHRHPCG